MKRYFLLSIILILFFNPAKAGDNEKSLKAKKINTKIIIDGRLNEPEWKAANPVSDFMQLEPIEGGKPTEKTEIKVLYDDDNLYFGCMMYDSEPDKIVATLTRRDNEIESDVISIRLDTYHDHLTNYEFTIFPSGTKVDILQFDDANKEDMSWDAVWDVKTSIVENGWIAEIKIPFKVLRFNSNSPDKIWGINIYRRISRKNERDYWVMIPKNQSGFTSHFGHLTGIDSVHSPTRLEILPYVVMSERMKPETETPVVKNKFSANSGFDLKYGLSSNITVDLTINPDFGQVEADPAVLNLSTFETFYPEKRPFFIEGTQILRFSGFGGDDGLFYSRRIGRRPTKEPVMPARGYLKDYPDFTTILGAAKITGKNEKGMSFGILDAITQNEFATVIDSLGNSGEQKVEPFANYFVARIKQDFWGNSTVGGIITSVNKNERYPAFTTGIDWNLKFFKGIYTLDGFLAYSKTSNINNERICGAAGRITFAKNGGEHWLYALSTDFTGKQYNINDIGFFRRPNDHGGNVELRYKDDKPNEITRYWIARTGYHLRWNFDKANLYRDIQSSMELIFLNYYELEISYSYSFGDYDDRETRGNGLYKKPKMYSISLESHSDESKPFFASITGSYSRNEIFAENYSISCGITMKPMSNIEFNLSLGYSKKKNNEAFLENITDLLISNNLITIFGDRNTDEYNLRLNGSMTFSPELTFEMYSQLFFAKGYYNDFRRLLSPESFRDYGYVGNPNFNSTHFQLNAVLRWEYLPGSTLYLVWTQSRGGYDKYYDTSFNGNFNDVFKSPMDNTILLKVSYWLNI